YDIKHGIGHWSSNLEWLLGYPDRALALAEQSVARAGAVGQPYLVAIAQTVGVSWVRFMRREPDAAYQVAELALATTEKYGFVEIKLAALFCLGIARLQAGLVDEGARVLKDAIAQSTERRSESNYSVIFGVAADCCRAVGRIDDARAWLNLALDFTARRPEGYWMADLHRVEGEVLLREAAPAQRAEACFRKALDVARSQQAKSLELRAATSLARLWQKQNRILEARDLLKPVYDWFTEGFDTPDLKDAKALLDGL
ncbi:MAG: hypothetical protein ACRESV_00025, partial [Nevskiales bacterium]